MDTIAEPKATPNGEVPKRKRGRPRKVETPAVVVVDKEIPAPGANRLKEIPQPNPAFTTTPRHARKDPDDGRRVNIGPGDQPLPGWENLDLAGGHDIRNLDIPDGSCDHIRASHCLEHLAFDDIVPTLQSLRAKLKQGGHLSIAVPDIELAMELYRQRRDPKAINYIFGGQTHPNDFHHSGFDRKTLTACLGAAGLGAVRPWYSEIADCASLPISLNLRATKLPLPVPPPILLCMTIPRLGFTETQHCLAKLARDTGLDLAQSTGVYYHMGMTRLFEDVQKRGHDYIMGVDYDSVFTTGNVLTMMETLEQFGCMALAPVQVGREMETVLATVADEKGELLNDVPLEMLAKPVMKIRTAHFGLTIIRAACLAKVEKPWFQSVPDKDGGWGDGRIDADVNFWLKWRDAGLDLHMANDVVVGHAQLMVSWPARDYKPRHQYLGDFHKFGKPDWAR